MHRFLWAACVLLPLPAHAGVIMTIERTGVSVDNPQFTFTSTEGFAATHIAVTLGDTSYNFDYALPLSQTGTFALALLSPDTLNAEVRSDVLAWELIDFSVGSQFSARVDIDRDVGPATVDWQEMLFNNGELANAVLTVGWTDGTATDVLFHDEAGRDPLVPYSISVEAVPEASSLLLGAAAISITLFFRRKR